ncbi:MAG TPA: hypothetical protein VIU61_26380 [Kofleriaceae bacterium]
MTRLPDSEKTEEVDTAIFDDERRARARSPTLRGSAAVDEERTDVDPEKQDNAQDNAKTRIAVPRSKRQTKRGSKASPVPVKPERSEPLPIISMKDALSASAEKRAAKEHRVQLRPLSEVRRAETQPQNLGFLAPPRDPKAVRIRRFHDLVMWGSVVVIVGCLVMLAVWFLARN